MLKKFFEELLGKVCAHKYEIQRSGHSTDCGSVIGTYYELRCTKCGHMKVRNLK